MSEDRVRVTCFDPRTGEEETQELSPDSYILVTGERMEIASYQQWARSGTVQIVLKRKAVE